jgi:uncharacterized protein (DUF1800 family)
LLFSRLAGAAAVVAIALSAPVAGDVGGRTAWAGAQPKFTVPSDDPSIVHVLNRLGFGARPGEVERVRGVGLAAYIEQQLHPERSDDQALDARLKGFKTLTMSTRELADAYLIPALAERRERQRQEAARGTDPAAVTPAPRGPGQPWPDEMRSDPAQPGAGPLDPAAREARRRDGAVLGELSQQKLLRAIYSERQLQEVLVDFWFNHFNVFAGKGPDRIYLTSYERDVIRLHALGRFRDLLGAVAQSPAMLFYLDNWMSADPEMESRLAARRPGFQRRPGGLLGRGRPGRPDQGDPRMTPDQAPQQRPQMPRGLNENYARELMELHTLGVDGGYTQKDVVEVARAFTGWTITTPRLGGLFRFDERMHDDKEKLVLGHTIKAGGGRRDGEEVLDILAAHPSTARFIATKLARRLVADDPPASLVDRAAARFRETGGDIREVVRAIVLSPEFFAPEARRAKVKTPFEFVASALRATGASVANAQPLAVTLRDLGMPLYFAQPPTGYADRADAWVNTGALLNRMNFAVGLFDGRMRGVTVDLSRLAGTAELPAGRTAVVSTILPGEISAATRGTIEKGETLAEVAALAVGSPEFQRR